MSVYVDGYINQLFQKISSLLYEPIVEFYRDIILDGTQDIEKSKIKIIKEVLLKYGIIKNNTNDGAVDTIPIMMEPETKSLDALKQRRLYRIKGIMNDYKKEKKYYTMSEVEQASMEKTELTPYCFIDLELKKGEKTLEQLIEEYDKRFEEWVQKAKRKSAREPKDRGYFCDYPYIRFYNERMKRIFYEIDLESNILYIIQSNALIEFAQFKPIATVQAGFFRESGKRNSQLTYDFGNIDTERYMAAFVQSVESMEEGKSYLTNYAPFVMDERGARLMNVMSTRCYRNYRLHKSGDTSGTLGDVVKIIYPEVKQPSSTHYETARLYLLNLTFLCLEKVKGGYEKKNIFEGLYVDVKEDAHAHMFFKVSLSTTFIKEMTNMRFATIISTTMDDLKRDISRLLYQDMKVDRLHDMMSTNNGENITHHYSITDMQLMARVKGRKSQKIMKYKDALNELIDKKVMVKNIEYIDEGFDVTWLPLTESEYSDVMLQDQNLELEEEVIN